MATSNWVILGEQAVPVANLAGGTSGQALAFDPSSNLTAIGAPLPVFNVLAYGATGNGSTDDTTAIAAAHTAATAAGGSVYFPVGTFKVTGPITTASNVKLTFQHGGVISLSGSGALTILGLVEAAPGQQIFNVYSGGPSVKFFSAATTGASKVFELHAAWFGVKGDADSTIGNGTDNTQAFKNAIAACATLAPAARFGGKLKIGRGYFRITDTLLVDISAGLQGLTIEGELSGGSGVDLSSTIIVDFDASGTGEKSGTAASISASGTTATLTGLSGVVSTDVNNLIYLSNSATSANNGVYQIASFVSATSVTISDPTGVWTLTNDAGGAVKWWILNRAAIRFLSRDCVIKNLAFLVAQGRTIKTMIEDTKGASGVCSNNRFENLRFDNQGAANTHYMVGFLHGDNYLLPGTAPFPTDCENNYYLKNYVQRCDGYAFYLVNNTGQSKDLVLDQCNLQGSGGTNVRAGIWAISGSMILRQTNVAYSRVGILAACEYFTIYDIESEGLGTLYRSWSGSGSNGNVNFHGGRCSSGGDVTLPWTTTATITSDANITTTTLTTTTTHPFRVTDVGSQVLIKGAGVAGADLTTWITGFTSSSSVTVSPAASTPVTNATAYYGTDWNFVEYFNAGSLTMIGIEFDPIVSFTFGIKCSSPSPDSYSSAQVASATIIGCNFPSTTALGNLQDHRFTSRFSRLTNLGCTATDPQNNPGNSFVIPITDAVSALSNN